MGVLKLKMAIFWKKSLTQKNVTGQKRFVMSFYMFLGSQKFFLNFSKIFQIFFMGQPLGIFFFFEG